MQPDRSTVQIWRQLKNVFNINHAIQVAHAVTIFHYILGLHVLGKSAEGNIVASNS